MSVPLRWIPAVVLLAAPAAWAGGDYVGVLRPSPTAIAIPEPGLYWGDTGLFGRSVSLAPGQEGFKLKLGYRYSRYLSVETGFSDVGWDRPTSPFADTSTRARGFSMVTVGTVPLWTHLALYGRFGAWRTAGAAPLLAASDTGHRAGAGLRYGLGLKYDITRQFGLKAEMERFSPLDRWGARESDTDQVSVGVSWRF